MTSPITRRAWLQQGSLLLAGLGARSLPAAAAQQAPRFRVGLMTDLHHADKEPAGTRHYRETLGKLDEAVARFHQERPSFVVELGDFIDQAPSVEQELEWLKAVEARYARLPMPRHYVLGNHCVTTLTKAEFAAHTGAAPAGHHAFDHDGVRFLILDACHREDGQPYGRQNFHWRDANIPRPQLDWLQDQLAAAGGPVVVFAHQRLDHDTAHAVRNAAEVRARLEKSGKVLAVFQGHSHKNDCQEIAGIHYVTLVAMIEGSGPDSSGYALLDVLPDGSLRLQGFRRQTSRTCPTRP